MKKKFALIVSIFFFLFSLSSCSNKPNEKKENGVYLITNGGTLENDTFTEIGKLIIIDHEQYIPTRDNYTFEGWYYDEQLSDLVPKGTKLEVVNNQVLEVYASWLEETKPSSFTYQFISKEEETYCQINSLLSEEANIVVPSYIKGEKVKSFNTSSFANKTNLQTIVLPEGLETIGNNAFENDTNLEKVDFSKNNSLVNINEKAFYNCGFTTFEFLDTIKYIGISAFENNSNLEQIKFTITSNLETLDYLAFANCDKLSDVTLPKSLLRLTFNTFLNTPYYEVEQMGSKEYYVFNDTLYFVNDVNLNKITNFNSGSFKNVGAYAFSEQKNLVSLDLPNTVETLLKNALSGLNKIQHLQLPNSLKNINEGALEGLSIVLNLEDTSIASLRARSFANYLYSSIKLPSSINYVASSSFKDYTGDVEFNSNSSVRINSAAFEGYLGKNVDFKNTITSISDKCFNQAINLKEVNGLEKVTTIGQNAFANCSKLEKISLPNTLTRISNRAFLGCTSIKSLYLYDSITYIGINAFEGFTKKQIIYMNFSKEKTELFSPRWLDECKAGLRYNSNF